MNLRSERKSIERIEKNSDDEEKSEIEEIKSRELDKEKKAGNESMNDMMNDDPNLIDTMREHVNAEPKTKYCPECGKVFRGKTNNLTRHMRDQHSKNKFIQMYECVEAECSFMSQWSKNLKVHLSQKHGYSSDEAKQAFEETEPINVKNESKR